MLIRLGRTDGAVACARAHCGYHIAVRRNRLAREAVDVHAGAVGALPHLSSGVGLPPVILAARDISRAYYWRVLAAPTIARN